MFQNTGQVIMKVTRGCNLRCSYCYVYDKNKYHGESMSINLYTEILTRWFSETKRGNLRTPNDGIKDDRQDTLSLVLHGGEPLSVGKEKFMQYAKIAYQLARRYGKVVSLSTQTNGTLIDEDWMSIFRKYKIQPGISFDGFGESAEERNHKDGLLTILLKLLGAGITPGVLMILHKSNYKDIVQNLSILEAIGINSIKINRAVDVTSSCDSDYELTVDELLEAAEKICNFMWTHPDFNEGVLFQQMVDFTGQTSKGLYDGKDRNSHCYTRYCGAGKAIVEVEPDGSTQFCGRNSKKSDIVTNGHVKAKDILEFQNIRRQWKFQKYKYDSVVNLKCNLCPAQAICDGGCMSFSLQKFGTPQIDPLTCEYFKRLHKFFTLNSKIIYQYLGDRTKNEFNSHFNL
ncbi:MAG: radical SAM protein [bacterium]